MPTWAIKDVTFQRSHAITIVMEETADDGRKYIYSVTQEPGAPKEKFLTAFKTQVLTARANRAKLAAIKAQINVNQIEAFLAQ